MVLMGRNWRCCFYGLNTGVDTIIVVRYVSRSECLRNNCGMKTNALLLRLQLLSRKDIIVFGDFVTHPISTRCL